MARWLKIHLEAPLMSFGGAAIDNYGPTDRHPALSMVTGLIANALGWDWSETEKLARLQERLVIGSLIIRDSRVRQDVQNVGISPEDCMWTTRGEPFKREGSIDSDGGIHRRFRDYLEDGSVVVVLSLTAGDDEVPTLEEIAERLAYPARPLFIGRKNCMPTHQLIGEDPFVEAETAYQALKSVGHGKGRWPHESGPVDGDNVYHIGQVADRRNWATDFFQGKRTIVEGIV